MSSRAERRRQARAEQRAQKAAGRAAKGPPPIRRLSAGAHVVAIHWLAQGPDDPAAAITLADGRILLAGATEDGDRTVSLGCDALCAALLPDAAGLVVGTEDGDLALITGDAGMTRHALPGRGWTEHVTAIGADPGEDPIIIAARGRTLVLVGPGSGAEAVTHAMPSGIGGLAPAPDGRRLAVAHYGGATILDPGAMLAGMDGSPRQLEWGGSHTGVGWSPDGAYLVTTMQENALHGWRLDDGADMQMSGYPARARWLSWTPPGSPAGPLLLTDGASQVVAWPFDGPQGPMERNPRLLGPEGSRVTAVAAHPHDPAVAAGDADGASRLLRLSDGAAVSLAAATAKGPQAAVTALAWSADGRFLATGRGDGEVALFAFDR